MIYLDNAATTQVAPGVLESMLPFFVEHYGNPGTIYSLGVKSAEAVRRARELVALYLGCTPDHVVFTSGGTEANNLAILGSLDYLRKTGKTHIIFSAVEHDSIHNTAGHLESHGFSISYVQPDMHGQIHTRYVLRELKDNTGFVAVMRMNNELGTVNNTWKLSNALRERGVLLLSDHVQTAGSCSILSEEDGFDFVSISSHKLHGPKGVGALYVRDPGILSPIIFGGHSQEFGLRGGTENVPGIVGFGTACEETVKQGVNPGLLRKPFYKSLRDALYSRGLTDAVRVNGPDPSRPGKVISLSFPGVDAETLVLLSDSMGVCVSAGSACRSMDVEPSRVLTAIGLTAEEARSTIRVSFSRQNTEEEVVKAAQIIAKCVEALKTPYIFR